MILPPEVRPLVAAFVFSFTNPTYQRFSALLVGAVLTTGRRTVAHLLRIRLSAAREGGTAVERVTDNGVGSHADVLPRLFDLFTQADRSLDCPEGGIGIGLTLVRSLVEMHGGTTQAASEGPGRGSEFVVRLSAIPVGDPKPIPRASTTPGGLASPSRILIVDDNVDAAATLAELLTSTGQEVCIFHDGPAARAAAPTHRPGVVLLDIGLPRMDGYEVARRLAGGPTCRASASSR